MLEDGVNYASLTDYRKAKGIPAGGGSGNEGEGEDLQSNPCSTFPCPAHPECIREHAESVPIR